MIHPPLDLTLAVLCGLLVLAYPVGKGVEWLMNRLEADRKRKAAAIAEAREVLACLGCEFCHDLSEMGEPEDCECPVPCGKAWCSALRRVVTEAADA